MKMAPLRVTDVAIALGLTVAAYGAWRVYSTLQSRTVSGLVSELVSDAVQSGAVAVDVRATPGVSDSDTWIEALAKGNGATGVLASYQNWVAQSVRKGQESGSSTFVGSFFTGLFK
jgi:hypothetical protein